MKFSKKGKTALSLIVFLAAAHGYAAGSHEISGATQASISLATENSISVSGAYAYSIMTSIQLSTKLNFLHYAGNNALTVMAGPVYNLSGDIENAIFAGGHAGLAVAAGNTDFSWEVFLGKRFQLINGVSYKPYLGYTKTGSADGSFNIVPASFSIHL